MPAVESALRMDYLCQPAVRSFHPGKHLVDGTVCSTQTRRLSLTGLRSVLPLRRVVPSGPEKELVQQAVEGG